MQMLSRWGDLCLEAGGVTASDGSISRKVRMIISSEVSRGFQAALVPAHQEASCVVTRAPLGLVQGPGVGVG